MKRNLLNWRKVKRLVIKRDNGLCVLCGALAVDVHHVKFRSQGGKDDVRNCVCLCRKCHDMAHGLHKYISAKKVKAILMEYLEKKEHIDKKGE